jgi:multidrug efflux pump subunit AcrA (membrane-fusion protein)
MTTPSRLESVRDLKPDAAALRIEGDRRTRRPHRALWGVAATTLLLAALAGWWWLSGSRVPEVQTAVVTMSESGVGNSDQTVLNASGYVTARRRATVSARVTGKITEVLVEEGMPVRQGQVLARLDDSSARAALDLAESQLAAARSNLDEIAVRVREAQTNQAREGRLAAAGIRDNGLLSVAQWYGHVPSGDNAAGGGVRNPVRGDRWKQDRLSHNRLG